MICIPHWYVVRKTSLISHFPLAVWLRYCELFPFSLTLHNCSRNAALPHLPPPAHVIHPTAYCSSIYLGDSTCADSVYQKSESPFSSSLSEIIDFR